MRKLMAIFVVTALIMGSAAAFAAQKGSKGASAKAYEHANDQAVFNRVSDWFATRGKSEAEKPDILQERSAIRAQKRAEKEAKRAGKEVKKEQKRIRKETRKSSREMKGKKKGRK